MTRAKLLCALLLLLGGACRERRAPRPNIEPSARASRSPLVPSLATQTAPVPAPSRPAPSASACGEPSVGFDRARLEATLRAWQAAQRHADASGYSRFYGDHFSGLQRQGPSVSLVDRAGWLAAHEPGIAPSLSNAAPQLAFGAGGARVRLGLDELFFTAGASGPQIAWEAPALAASGALSQSLPVWPADEYGALLSATPDPSWADGPPVGAGPNRATCSVRVSRLPKTLSAWLGRRVKVLGPSGVVCETRLQRLTLEARITPDLRTAEHWEGCADGPPIAAETVASEVWQLSAGGGRALLGEFSASCKGALLALDPDLPTPPIAAPKPASAELGAQLLSAFRALPAYAAIQGRYRAEHPDAEGAWDDHDASRSVSSLELPGHPPVWFVSVAAGAGCNSFSASLSAVWAGELGDEGQVVSAIDDARLTPSAVFDLDGTGSTILLGPDGRFQARSMLRARSGASPSWERFLLSSVPYFAGPC